MPCCRGSNKIPKKLKATNDTFVIQSVTAAAINENGGSPAFQAPGEHYRAPLQSSIRRIRCFAWLGMLTAR